MIYHFTTADGCERWQSGMKGPHEPTLRVPIRTTRRLEPNAPFVSTGAVYSIRVYKVESIDYARGVINYVESI